MAKQRMLLLAVFILMSLLTVGGAAKITVPVGNGGAVDGIIPEYGARYVLWDNPLIYGDIVDALNSSGGFHCQDDFTLTQSATIQGFECWGILFNGPGESFQLTLYNDGGGYPGSVIWFTNISDVTSIDTGLDYSGYDINRFIFELEPGDYFEATAGTTYWIEIYYQDAVGWYWLCADGGNMYQNGTNMGYDAFFRVLGTINTALETASWGAIKALD